MEVYKVVISKSAEKEISKLPVKEILKIKETILDLADNPRPYGVKKLEGFDEFYRIRKGNYRIIYTIEDDILTVEVLKVGNRKDVYKR
ncbi:type II toxin-antitoxin system RelE/ParE family toxin [Arcicella sp. LKC2W]|uniref:type II toxin-antitoxin system RelE family toxin n=1 Tax=Arcicella sp. LKC2W TaxID=2984198 RepID=UPI002B1E98DB|nr:type II toxin-antitoxin system RelE/ParE family toxin [Arcicella sp. LKC2W]MEA5458173.1 type II toxin-antitoxin system RelE/ParE family toxin [Arcicella sp. LKC2W]